jgi:hypothetical protein
MMLVGCDGNKKKGNRVSLTTLSKAYHLIIIINSSSIVSVKREKA